MAGFSTVTIGNQQKLVKLCYLDCMKKYIILFAILALFVSCVTLPRGYEFILEGNPTTGYVWVYEVSGEGKIDITETVESKNEALLGAGSKYIYTIGGLAPGKVDIEFSYLRPWEGEAIDEVHLSLYVNNDLTVTRL